MRRQPQAGPWKQLPLAFHSPADPESAPVLRAAYSRLKLARRLTFEQVMADRALAIGVRHLAHAIVRREVSGNARQSAPATGETGTDTVPVLEPRRRIN